jgi:hypothetical protein
LGAQLRTLRTHFRRPWLSTVGQPFIQGNHKLYVIEMPFGLRIAHSKAMMLYD